MLLPAELDAKVCAGEMPLSVGERLSRFFCSYERGLFDAGVSRASMQPFLEDYLNFIVEQVAHPTCFGSYHKRMLSPVNYHRFGVEFFRPLIDFGCSSIVGLHNADAITRQLAAGDNVFLLANHQTEIDPQIIYMLLEGTHRKLGEELIFVAGHRVTTDPMAVPFSLGCNLLCIHSKKHIDTPPERKQEKLQHNRRTMHEMRQLLARGGVCIYIAPSGGRDRPNDAGDFDLAPFDPPSLEMTILQTRQVPRPTHFYPLALLTYPLLPPPKEIRKQLGERRETAFTPVHAAFGREISIDIYPGNDHPDKKSRRCARAEYIHSLVKQDYELLKEKKTSFQR